MTTPHAIRHHLSVLAVGGLTVTGLTVAGPAQAAELDYAARMHATSVRSNAGGHAEYDSGAAGRQFEISLRGVRRLAGRELTVRAHGAFVGKMTVGRNGRVHLSRHVGVTKMGVGTEIRVRTASGNLVAHGTMHRDRQD